MHGGALNPELLDDTWHWPLLQQRRRQLKITRDTFPRVGCTNTLHQFGNSLSESPRMLCVYSPSGQEEFFREVGTPVTARESHLTELATAKQTAFSHYGAAGLRRNIKPNCSEVIVENVVVNIGPEFHAEVEESIDSDLEKPLLPGLAPGALLSRVVKIRDARPESIAQDLRKI